MGDSDENTRTIAMCHQCGGLYAAFEITDGTFRPIGRRDGCQYGCTEFAPVNDSFSDPSLEEDTTD